MTKEDLIQEGFNALNNFKRHRALEDIKPTREEKQYHELQMFKMIDKLELTLRALNKEFRESQAELTSPNSIATLMKEKMGHA